MIGNDIADALPGLRIEAESLMRETCSIERQVATWDEVQQTSVTTWAPVHVSIPCRFSVAPATSRVLLTDESVTIEGPVVKVSTTVLGVEPDDRVTVVGIGVVWVTDVPTYSDQVQRRIQCRWVR